MLRPDPRVVDRIISGLVLGAVVVGAALVAVFRVVG